MTVPSPNLSQRHSLLPASIVEEPVLLSSRRGIYVPDGQEQLMLVRAYFKNVGKYKHNKTVPQTYKLKSPLIPTPRENYK